MEINKIKKEELRDVIISVRTFKSYSKWMKEKEVSPSKLFNEALKELMGKTNGKLQNKK